jgi:hypothetical protein
MRWLYYNASDPEESTAHTSIERNIDDWWYQFACKANDIDDLFSHRSEWDLPAWMERHLQAISADLMWEFGQAVRGDGHRLVITPEAEKHLRPLVQTLLERAPSLTGWEFYAYRLPEDLEMAHQMVTVRAGGDLSGTLATAMIAQHNRIDLCYYSHTTRNTHDKQALHNAFVATETLLGEELLDKWVGSISVDHLRRSSGIAKLLNRGGQAIRGLIPLERLRPTVSALVASIQDQLPDKPLYVLQPDIDAPDSQTTHFLMELEPTPADEYPGHQDLFVAVTANANLWRAMREDALFYSERYSRHGETFCYLKLDGKQGSMRRCSPIARALRPLSTKSLCRRSPAA